MSTALATADVGHFYVPGAAGNRIHGLDFGGDGPTLVCLHGVTGNAWNWHAVALGVRAHRRVVALDFRGYGESQWSAAGAYTTADHVADLGRSGFAAVAGGSPVDLAGSSWGALVALQYADEHPDQVGRLAVVETSSPPSSRARPTCSPAPGGRTTPTTTRSAPRWPAPIPTPPMRWSKWWRPPATGRSTAAAWPPMTPHQWVSGDDPFFFERWPFRSDDHWDRLPRIQAPTLHVHASGSFVRAEVMAEMDRLTPESSLVEIDDSTHVVPVDNPSALIQALLPFLTGA